MQTIKEIKEKTGADVSYGRFNKKSIIKINTENISYVYEKKDDNNEFKLRKYFIGQNLSDKILQSLGTDIQAKRLGPRNRKYYQYEKIKNNILEKIEENKNNFSNDEIIDFVNRNEEIIGEIL